MKLVLFTVYIFLSTTFLNAQEGSESFSSAAFTGTYQGMNIYVQNPNDKSGIGFSVKSVEVNGTKITQQVFSSAFEIDLLPQNLNIGDSVTILFRYNSDELPKVINLGALTSISSAIIDKIWIEGDSILKWCSKNEGQKTDYVIEQYRWNKWIKIGEVMSSGTIKQTCYEFVLSTTHNDNNKFRVSQFNSVGKKISSEFIEFKSAKSKVYIINDYIYDGISFSESTLFEIFNACGDLVSRGYGNKIDFCGLPVDLYYVNYGNVTGDVFSVHQKFPCEEK